MTTGHTTDLCRSAEVLKGICAAISADYTITDTEIDQLNEWLLNHANLLQTAPFNEAKALIERITADAVVDEDERDELLEWCQYFSDPHSYPIACITDATRRLHGFMHGISMDGEITEQEARDLYDWLHDYEWAREQWPFYEVWDLMEAILKDGEVDKDEQDLLLRYCINFAELPESQPVRHDTFDEPWMLSGAPILKSIAYICDPECDVIVPGQSFCFTGLLRSGKRKDAEQLVLNAGGAPKRNVTLDLNFLVIGAQSSPCWAFSAYGRKVETAIKYRRQGAPIGILGEECFLASIPPH